MTKCSKVYFSKDTLKKLRKVLDDNTEKEISGSLKIKFNKNKNIYEVSLGKFSKGEIEECDLVETMYNFHTHPQKAYDIYNTSVGWPSESDFKTFMYCFFQYKNILHCVLSLEGIYVITIRNEAYDYLLKSPSKQETKQRNIDKYIRGIYIDKGIHINDRPTFNSKPITKSEQYISFVNNYEMLKGLPLFEMFFIEWDKPETIILCNPWKCEKNDKACKKRKKNASRTAYF